MRPESEGKDLPGDLSHPSVNEGPPEALAFCRKALHLPGSAPVSLLPLSARGSDRDFFRLKWNQTESAILIHYDPKRVENTYHADIALFLHEIHVPAPRLIGHDPENHLLVIEDLGDTDLWSFRESPWEIRGRLYRETLIACHRLHSFPEGDFPSDRVKRMEDFNPDLYRWEREYFKKHFVGDVCGIKNVAPFERELEAELSALADRLCKTGRSLLHRDFQSRNVMIRGGQPFLIDFQGMRFGSLYYDLGSLLCDPYVRFSVRERDELLHFYYDLLDADLSWITFQQSFWEASAQRLMQALGAYGFLGLTKGLKDFLKAIPAGIETLRLATVQADSLPFLRDLAGTCLGFFRKHLPQETG